MLSRLARLWQRAAAPRAPDARPQPVLPLATLNGSVAAAGVSVAEWVQRRRRTTALHTTVSANALAMLRSVDPGRIDATLRAAERVLHHEFDLLGSGAYTPQDPDRPSRNGYIPIDWYLDPVRQLRFPRGVPHKQWNLYEMRPANADIKYPWELARCQHWVPLGQAYLFTRANRFALEIARQLDDFVSVNPTGIGVNWTCTMDVGLRAVSWSIALELVRDSSALDDAFWARAYEVLFDHGVFIRNNLENTYEVTSNHYLSNLLGLLFVGAIFADLPEGKEWLSFSRDAIEREMMVQVLPDGADYESSIPYHRLVAELFLGAARLTDHRGEPLPHSFRARLRDMIDYLAAVTRPDGLMPQVGDADDGRLHIVEGYGTTSPQDPRHLFGPAGAMFDVPEWRALGGSAGAWEAAWWGFDVSAAEASPPPTASRLFRDAGVAVARTASGHYLLVTNGVVGTNGFGNHKHNDLLSFEYHHLGVPLVVDPGSYVYTSDPDARNRFRGTASHNTLMIDGVEQNDLRPDWLFRLFETSHAESLTFSDGTDLVEYVGRHRGYERLSDPVTHERTFRFCKETGRLVLVDRLTGRGRHQLRWHFHLAPSVYVQHVGTTIYLGAGSAWCSLRLPLDVTANVQPADYSPSYGVKHQCFAIDVAADADLDGERTWEFSIEP